MNEPNPAPTVEETRAETRGRPARMTTISNEVGQLFDRYYDVILTYVTRRLLNMSDAEEITSETFTRMVEALPSISPSEPARRAWLYRTATNLIHDLRRRRVIRREVPLPDVRELGRWVADPGEDPETLAARLEELHAMSQTLGNLGEKYENVLILRFFEGLRVREIAEVLGARPGTVKWRLHVGLKKLESALSSHPSFRQRFERKGE